MANYVTCEYCGANNDHGERCDCLGPTEQEFMETAKKATPEGFAEALAMLIQGNRQQKTALDATTSKGGNNTIIHQNNTPSIHLAGAEMQEGGF